MRRLSQTLSVLMLGLSSLGFAGAGYAQEAGGTVVIREATDNDFYAAARDVTVQAAVAGDAVIAGASLVVTGDVSDDVIAAGRSVTISGAVGDDVRLAGNTVTLAGPVAGHAVMAGAEVRIEAGSTVGEWVWAAGGRVYIAGRIGGELKVAGGDVELLGQVDGDAYIVGGRINIGDGAVINGDLTWRSDREPVISDNAIIKGQIIRGPPLESDREREGGGLLFRLFMALTLTVTAGVLYTVFRSGCEACSTLLQTRPFICLLTGLAVFATTPLIVMILFATGIGALLGVVLLLAYSLALLLGVITGVIGVARLGLKWGRRSREPAEPSPLLVWLAIAIVVIAITLLGPLGAPVGSLLMFFGLGSLSLEGYRRINGVK